MKTTLPHSSRLWLGLAAVLVMAVPGARAADFFFHDGDQPVVFLGNTIAQDGKYTAYIETYVLSRYPHWNITFRNMGMNGDTMGLTLRGGLEAGLKRDVLPLHPRAITILEGFDDPSLGDPLETYVTNATKLVQQLKSAGARVALVTSSPAEGDQANEPAGSSFNRSLRKAALGLQKVAEQEGVRYVDEHAAFVSAIETGRQAGVLSSNATDGNLLIQSGWRPSPAGSLVMATAILKGLGAASAVSRVEIDAKAGKVTAVEGCQIDLQPATGGALAFRRTDQCLPWFIPDDARLALKIPGFTPLEDLSRYELRVTHLTAPQYKLTIDDVEAGTFPKEKLAAGVNLSLQAGPITAQAEKLFKSVVSKNDFYLQRLVEVWWGNLPGWVHGPGIDMVRQKELARRDAEIAKAEQTINELRQPVPHVFKLTPVE